jgi:DNA-directed RNA polymerase specialized sigma24 family protein
MLHEIDGKSFKEISETTGASVNTLLSRKRYAVLSLRERLKTLYKELINN